MNLFGSVVHHPCLLLHAVRKGSKEAMGPQRALSDFYSKPPLIQHHDRASSLEACRAHDPLARSPQDFPCLRYVGMQLWRLMQVQVLEHCLCMCRCLWHFDSDGSLCLSFLFLWMHAGSFSDWRCFDRTSVVEHLSPIGFRGSTHRSPSSRRRWGALRPQTPPAV